MSVGAVALEPTITTTKTVVPVTSSTLKISSLPTITPLITQPLVEQVVVPTKVVAPTIAPVAPLPLVVNPVQVPVVAPLPVVTKDLPLQEVTAPLSIQPIVEAPTLPTLQELPTPISPVLAPPPVIDPMISSTIYKTPLTILPEVVTPTLVPTTTKVPTTSITLSTLLSDPVSQTAVPKVLPPTLLPTKPLPIVASTPVYDLSTTSLLRPTVQTLSATTTKPGTVYRTELPVLDPVVTPIDEGDEYPDGLMYDDAGAQEQLYDGAALETSNAQQEVPAPSNTKWWILGGVGTALVIGYVGHQKGWF